MAENLDLELARTQGRKPRVGQWLGKDIEDLSRDELKAALKYTLAETQRREDSLRKLVEMQHRFTRAVVRCTKCGGLVDSEKFDCCPKCGT